MQTIAICHRLSFYCLSQSGTFHSLSLFPLPPLPPDSCFVQLIVHFMLMRNSFLNIWRITKKKVMGQLIFWNELLTFCCIWTVRCDWKWTNFISPENEWEKNLHTIILLSMRRWKISVKSNQWGKLWFIQIFIWLPKKKKIYLEMRIFFGFPSHTSVIYYIAICATKRCIRIS